MSEGDCSDVTASPVGTKQSHIINCHRDERKRFLALAGTGFAILYIEITDL